MLQGSCDQTAVSLLGHEVQGSRDSGARIMALLSLSQTMQGQSGEDWGIIHLTPVTEK